MKHECIAPAPWGTGQCGAVFYGRADATYCCGACRKRAHSAKPEVIRRKRLKRARRELNYGRRQLAYYQGSVRDLEAEVALLESFDARQLDLVDASEPSTAK